MKVLQVISSFPPAYDYGGPPRSAHNLSKALVERGHDVTVFTTDALDAEQRVTITTNPETQDGIETFRFKNISNALSWKNIPLAPGMMSGLFRKANHFDVVHTHEYRSFHTLFSHLVSQAYDIPHVLQPRGSIPRFEESKLKSSFDKIAGQKIAYDADRIIASSHSESSQFDQVVPELRSADISHIPNGIEIEDYTELPTTGKFRRRLGIAEETDIILFLSRLHPRKGGDLLLDAVSELLAEQDRTLVFVGPDEGHRDELERQAQETGHDDSVYFTGPLYGKTKLEAYVDADVFVLPSKNRYESFGNVVIEAMACGTPTVSTDVCGVSEWIDHESCPTVEATPTALRDGIDTVLDRPSVPAESLRQYVWQNFTWDTVAANTAEVYKEVAQ